MENINQVIPEVEVQVGAKTYKIRCSFGLLARFQKATGLNPFDQTIWDMPSPIHFAALIWAGISPLEPKLTVEQVAEELSVSQAKQVRDILVALMSAGTASIEKNETAQAA